MRHKPQQGTLTLPDRSVWVAGDEVRIQQVLVNVWQMRWMPVR